MIRNARKRSWRIFTDECDQDQEPYLRLTCNRTPMLIRNKDATPWYLKLLCEERTGEDDQQGSSTVNVAQQPGPTAAKDPTATAEPDPTAAVAAAVGQVARKTQPCTSSSGNPRTLDYVVAKKLKASRKSQQQRMYYHPYGTESEGMIRKYNTNTI